jgi:hypothetical protein
MSHCLLHVCSLVICLAGPSLAQQEKNDDSIRQDLQQYQYDLDSDGKHFLQGEARQASFFLLGELHGENEIPSLLRELWPQMWRDNYRYIAAEVSPWATHQLEFALADSPKVAGLWSRQEAQFVHSQAARSTVLWGCDMEEMQPQLLMRDLAATNPKNQTLVQMLEITNSGYRRTMAPELLGLADRLGGVHDPSINGVSLLRSIQTTLKIDSDRLNSDTKLPAQIGRESLMKDLFLQHYKANISADPTAKVMLRFGRNHLHRGYDARGISTLGNFVAEFAFSEHKTVFNVAAFGAGGKASLAGETWDADERGDDLAFAFLASLARYSATVFDLRPLRTILHQIGAENRSPLQQRLIYWADSYDAVICYKNVTPLNPQSRLSK